MGSLQDQLLKAGLATPEQLRKAQAERRREQRRGPRARRDAQDGSQTPPGRRPPGRGRGAPAPEPPSAPDGKSARPNEGAAPAGREGKRRNRRGGGARLHRARPDAGRNESGPGRSADPLPGQDPSVQALNLRIRELLDRHAVNDRKAELAFNFTRENTVRRVYATDEQRRGLAGGELAIVGFRRRHHIVPARVADEIQALRPIVFVHRAPDAASDAPAPDSAAAEDDPYRDFPVPDDLHW